MIRRRTLHAESFTPNRKKKARVTDADAPAIAIRETFTDRPMQRVATLSWNWPKALLHVGRCEAVMYESDKWKARRGDMEMYKHVAEGPQELYVREGFIQPYDGHSGIEVVGMTAELSEMPESFAVLADAVGFQATLFASDDDGFYLPNRGGAVQVDTPGCKLGGGEHDSGAKFLVIYDNRGVCALITGEILDIEADGITG